MTEAWLQFMLLKSSGCLPPPPLGAATRGGCDARPAGVRPHVVHFATLAAPQLCEGCVPPPCRTSSQARRTCCSICSFPIPHTVVSLFQSPLLIPAPLSAPARLTSYLLPFSPPLWLPTFRG